MKRVTSFVVAALCTSGLYAAKGDVYTGIVVDVLNGGGYTYLQIEDSFKKRHWAAFEGLKMEKGTEVRFNEEMLAENFKSKSLERTFEKLIFASNLQYRSATPEAGNLALINERVATSPYKKEGTLSVQEVMAQRATLKGKEVTIRAKVVKASENILERNWIHLQDGTGEGDEVGRIVFTSKELPKVGDVVVAKGVVEIDKNFGSGYIYPIIIENARFSH